MHGTHCKYFSLIPLLVFKNNFVLLICGYMCAETLVHILRYLSRICNNNKRYQLIIHYVFYNSSHMHLDYNDVRYIVYTWGFSCLDYSFNILISWSHKLGWTAGLPYLLSSDSTSDFWFYYYYYIYVYILSYHLCSIPMVFCSYHILPCMFLAWYHICISHHLLSLHAPVSVITTRFSLHAFWLEFNDTHVPDYACHLALTSPLIGEFWLP